MIPILIAIGNQGVHLWTLILAAGVYGVNVNWEIYVMPYTPSCVISVNLHNRIKDD